MTTQSTDDRPPGARAGTPFKGLTDEVLAWQRSGRSAPAVSRSGR